MLVTVFLSMMAGTLHAEDAELAKLAFKRQAPLVLKFNAYDGEPERDPQNTTFQISTPGIRTPTVFRKIGKSVLQDRFRLLKYAYKETISAKGATVEVSELTLRDNATSAEVVLVFNQPKDIGMPVAVLEYRGAAEPKELHVVRGSEFTLPPQKGRRYKLLEVSEDSATVQTPEGEKMVVRPR